MSIGTRRMRRWGRRATTAYRRIIFSYVTTSGPPMSNARFTSSGIPALPTRYRSTSRTAIGWMRVPTHLGVTMAGSRSVR